MIENTENANLFNDAIELLNKNENDAIDLFKKYVELDSDYDMDKKFKSIMHLAELTKDVQWYSIAFLLKTTREPLIKLADFFLTQKDYQKTICYLKAALEINETNNDEKLLWMLYYSYYYKGDVENSKIYFDKCILNKDVENIENVYLNDYRYYYELPKITIIGECERKDIIIYPSDKLEFVLNKNDATGEYIISSGDIIYDSTLMIEYLKKIKNQESNLFIIDEYPDEFKIIYTEK